MMATKMMAGYRAPTNMQASRLQEGMGILGASDGTPRLKKGSLNEDFDLWAGLSGIVAIVRPMRSEYPKCIEGIAANLFVYRLSVQIEPSPPGPWTVSTNLYLDVS